MSDPEGPVTGGQGLVDVTGKRFDGNGRYFRGDDPTNERSCG